MQHDPADAPTHRSRRLRVAALGLLVAWSVLTCARPAEAAPAAAGGAAAQMLALVNGERAAAGLPALEWRDDVAGIAVAWSGTMAATGLFAHNDAYFSDATRAQLGSATRGENVSNASSVEASHAGLMASPPHRANILSSEFTQIGIGIVTDAVGRLWVTQGFMRPSGAAAPAPAPAPEPVPEPAPAPAPAPQPAAPAPPPTTAPPTTAAPTTAPPTTVPPSTAPPTTLAPTTTSTAAPAGAAVAPPAPGADGAGPEGEPRAQAALALAGVGGVALAHARRVGRRRIVAPAAAPTGLALG